MAVHRKSKELENATTWNIFANRQICIKISSGDNFGVVSDTICRQLISKNMSGHKIP